MRCCCSSASDRGRFSYCGGRGGPLWQRISYKLSQPPTALHPPQQASTSTDSLSDVHTQPQHRSTTDSGAQPNRHGRCADKRRVEHDPSSRQSFSPGDQSRPAAPQQPGTLTIEDADHSITQQQVSVWDYLRSQLCQHKLQIDEETAQQLPFDFWGGYVGYLGYELKAECGGDNAHQAPTPDAAMFLADRYGNVSAHSNESAAGLQMRKSQ